MSVPLTGPDDAAMVFIFCHDPRPHGQIGNTHGLTNWFGARKWSVTGVLIMQAVSLNTVRERQTDGNLALDYSIQRVWP